MFLNRVGLLWVSLCLCSGSAVAVSMDVSGSQSPAEMLCPQFSSAPGAAQSMVSTKEAVEPPSLNDVGDVIGEPERVADQNIIPNVSLHPTIRSIGFWGDSHLAAAFFSDELVRFLGLGKEEVKPGFIPPTMGRRGVRLPIRKYCRSPGWSLSDAYVGRGEALKYGPALSYLENTKPESALWVDFRYQDVRPALKRLTVLFREVVDQPVEVEIEVDDGPATHIVLEKGESKIVLNGLQPFSQLRLSVVEGSLAIEGFEPVYVSAPKLRLDIFGIPGATARSWKMVHPLYMRSRLTDAEYDLVILQYGTNEGADPNFDPASYQASLSASLMAMNAAFPSAQCLLIGPPDRGVLVKKQPHAEPNGRHAGKRQTLRRADLLKYAAIHARIAEIQRGLAQIYGCGFWDWQLAMGGPGGAYKWFFKSPPLMAKDLIHLTRQGYQESARMFVENMRIQEWLR